MNENEILIYINKLPEELINVIKEYIPQKSLIFLDKTHYILYHSLIKTYIQNFDNYIRDVIRRDNEFVFERIVNENYSKWVLIKNYRYKNMTFKNYLFFVANFCFENDSSNCIKLINGFIKKLGLCKNLHKKNIIKYIR
jgi:hypothetical protein